MKGAKAVQAYLMNFTEYKAKYAGALAGVGTVDADYERRSKTNAFVTAEFGNAIDELNLSIGNTLLPSSTKLLKSMIPVVHQFEKFADGHPKLIVGSIKAATSIIGLRIAMSAGGWSAAYLKSGLQQVERAGLWTMGPVIRGLGGSFEKLVASSRGLRCALAVTGVGALGLGARFIASNVGGISRALDGIGPKLDKALGPQNAVMFKPVTESAQKLSDLFKTGFVLDDKTWATWVNEGIAGMARMAAQFKQSMFLITGNAKYAPPVEKPDPTDPGLMGGPVKPPGLIDSEFWEKLFSPSEMMKSTNRDIGRIMGLFAPRPDRPPDIEGEDFDTRRRRLRQEDRARFFDDLSGGIGGVRDWMKQIPGSDDWLGRVSSPAPLGNTRWSHLPLEPIMPPGSLAVPPRPQAPATPVADGSLFDQDAWQKFGTTTETAQQKLDGLSATTIAPQLDASAIDTAISKIETLLRKIGLVGSAAAARPTMADTLTARVTAGGSAGRTLRAGQNDYLHDNPD